jgi:hypothetical protein
MYAFEILTEDGNEWSASPSSKIAPGAGCLAMKKKYYILTLYNPRTIIVCPFLYRSLLIHV